MERSNRLGARLLLGAVGLLVIAWGLLPLVFFGLWPVALGTGAIGAALIRLAIVRR